MSLIANTTRVSQRSSTQYRVNWVVSGSVITGTQQSATITTTTITAAITDINYPSVIGTPSAYGNMTGQEANPMKNGWYTYTEIWVKVGTWS